MGTQCCASESVIDVSPYKIICLVIQNEQYYIRMFSCVNEFSNEIIINPNLFNPKGLSQISNGNVLYLVGSENNEDNNTNHNEIVSTFISIDVLLQPITISIELPPNDIHTNPCLVLSYDKEELYVIGGYNTMKCEYFSFKDAKWIVMPSLPNVRFNCNVACVNDSIVVYGGYKDNEMKEFDDSLILYDKMKIEWETIATIELNKNIERGLNGMWFDKGKLFLFSDSKYNDNDNAVNVEYKENWNENNNIEKFIVVYGKTKGNGKRYSVCQNKHIVFWFDNNEEGNIVKWDLELGSVSCVNFFALK